MCSRRRHRKAWLYLCLIEGKLPWHLPSKIGARLTELLAPTSRTPRPLNPDWEIPQPQDHPGTGNWPPGWGGWFNNFDELLHPHFTSRDNFYLGKKRKRGNMLLTTYSWPEMVGLVNILQPADGDTEHWGNAKRGWNARGKAGDIFDVESGKGLEGRLEGNQTRLVFGSCQNMPRLW